MNEPALTAEEQALLVRWLAARGPGAPTPEELAAWLTGRSAEAAAGSVEQALAADAGLRAALLAVREGALEQGAAAEIARLRALVRLRSGHRLRSGLNELWPPLVAASVVAAAACLGWMMGFVAAGDAVSNATNSLLEMFSSGPGL